MKSCYTKICSCCFSAVMRVNFLAVGQAVRLLHVVLFSFFLNITEILKKKEKAQNVGWFAKRIINTAHIGRNPRQARLQSANQITYPILYNLKTDLLTRVRRHKKHHVVRLRQHFCFSLIYLTVINTSTISFFPFQRFVQVSVHVY